MFIQPRRVAQLLFALAWLTLLVTACSIPVAGGTGADPATPTLQPGTLLWNYQGTSNVFTAAWSPNGHLLAIGEADGSVQVLDAMTGNVILSVHSSTQKIWAVAWSPDGTRFAAASWDTTVRVWDIATGRLLVTYRGHTGEALAVAWSPILHRKTNIRKV